MESSFAGWISIKEEMPKPEERVLLHTVYGGGLLK